MEYKKLLDEVDLAQRLSSSDQTATLLKLVLSLASKCGEELEQVRHDRRRLEDELKHVKNELKQVQVKNEALESELNKTRVENEVLQGELGNTVVKCKALQNTLSNFEAKYRRVKIAISVVVIFMIIGSIGWYLKSEMREPTSTPTPQVDLSKVTFTIICDNGHVQPVQAREAITLWNGRDITIETSITPKEWNATKGNLDIVQGEEHKFIYSPPGVSGLDIADFIFAMNGKSTSKSLLITVVSDESSGLCH